MIDALHGDFESTLSCSLSSLIKFPEINTKTYLRLLSSLFNELVLTCEIEFMTMSRTPRLSNDVIVKTDFRENLI